MAASFSMRIKCQHCLNESTVPSLVDGSTFCPNCGNLVAPTRDVPTVTYDEPAGEIAPKEEIPDSIGKYRILKKVGEGGCGVVYHARDDNLDCDVAVKVPRRYNSTELAAMMLEEARTLAKLRHPNIVRVLGADVSDDTFYIAMDWVEGQTLRDLMSSKRLSVKESTDLLVKIADAVHSAHKAGFVHRDLKPSNILLDRDGNPYVTDFGLAFDESTQRGRRNEFAGTISYMSPEQIRAESHYLDGRTDVWALGVMLYEMLTGRRPFSGSSEEVSDEICHREPKPLTLLNEEIPQPLEDVVKRAQAKEIDKRTSTAAQLRDEISAATSPAGSPLNSTQSFAYWRSAAIVLLAIALGVGAAAYISSGNKRPGSKEKPDSYVAAEGDEKTKPAEKGDDAISPPQDTPRVLVSGRWNKLLDRPLERVLMPPPETGSDIREDAYLEQVKVFANGRAVLKAGEIENPNCRITLRINQARWTSGFSVYHGYRKVDDGLFQYETILLHRFQDQFQIRRLVVKCNQIFDQLEAHEISAAKITKPGYQKHELTLAFKDGVLSECLWDETPLHSVVHPRISFDAHPVQGSFGIFLENCTVDISQFRIYLE